MKQLLGIVIMLVFGCGSLHGQLRPVGMVAASEGATISGQRVLPNQAVFMDDKIEVKSGGLVILNLSGKPLVLGEGSHTVGHLKAEDTKAKNPNAVSHVAAHIPDSACDHAGAISPSVPHEACGTSEP